MMKPLTGRGVLLWLGGFFGLIFATNALFITVAVKTFRGEDEQRPYLQGVRYNRTLADRAEQARLGWQATIDGTRMADGRTEIRVALRRQDGAMETGVKLVGELRHPADENRDQALRFSEVKSGLYAAHVRSPRGSWDVLVSSQGREPFRASRRLWLN